MSLECSECERDLRAGHAQQCSRHRPAQFEVRYFVKPDGTCWLQQARLVPADDDCFWRDELKWVDVYQLPPPS